MITTKLFNTSLWYYLLVSGTLFFCSGGLVLSQNDSIDSDVWLLERSTSLILEGEISQDSCINAYKAYFKNAFYHDKSSQGLVMLRDQVGRVFSSRDYNFTTRLIDSIGSWVELPLLSDKRKEDLAYLYIFKGFAYMQSKIHLSAIDAYEDALEVYESRYRDLCGGMNIGRCLILAGKKKEYDGLRRFVQYPLVTLYKKIGDQDLAKLYLPTEEEVGIIQEKQLLNDEEIATIYIDLIGSAFASKDTLKAYSLSQKVYQLYKGDSEEKFEMLLNLALVERTMGKFGDAHDHLNQVIRYVEKESGSDKISNRLWRDGHLFKGYTYRDQALLFLQSHPEKAEELLAKSKTEYTLLKDALIEKTGTLSEENDKYDKELIHLLHSSGDIEYYAENYTGAEEEYQKALSMLWEDSAFNTLPTTESLELDFNLFYTLEGLGKIWHKQYKRAQQSDLLSKASDAYALVFAMEDSFRVRYPTQGSRETQQKNSQKRLKAHIRIAYDLWEMNKDENSVQMALNIMDRSRALEMQAHLLNNSLEKELDNSQKKLIDSISSIQEKLYDLYLEEPEENDLLDHKMRIQEVNEQLLTYRNKLKKQNPTYYRLKYTPQISNLKALQEQIEENEALINYYWGDSVLYQLVIGHNLYNLIKYPIDGKLTEDIRFMTDFTKNSRPTKKEQLTYQETAYSLYKTLLGNVEELNFKNLIIVPDGPLGQLAFEALLTKKVDENRVLDYRQLSYVFQKYLIQYQFVPNFLLQEEKEKLDTSNEKSPILYAGFAPTYNFSLVSNASRAALGNLEFNVHEVDSVFNLFSSFTANNRRFIDAEAREAQFREVAPQAELLHVAMHALNNEEAPVSAYINDPYLLFSNQKEREGHDDRLFMQEIYGLGLQADLMVLSACNTGTGAWGVSEGMLSLGRAFRMAGCDNIISSLWNVNDESSQIIIQSFYESLLQGNGKAEALRKAKEAYLFNPQISSRKAAPYYWAQFVLMGDNSKLAMLENQRRADFILWASILALVALLGVGIYWKWRK